MNLRTRERTDLQSVAIDRSATPPHNTKLGNLCCPFNKVKSKIQKNCYLLTGGIPVIGAIGCEVVGLLIAGF